MTMDTGVFGAPAQTTTPTSPNTNVVASPTGDANNTTQLTFQYQGRIPVWTPSVSQAQTSVSLGADITIGATTWKAGITVVYAALSAKEYSVTIMSGEITDDRGSYSLAGLTLGIFKIKKPKAEHHAIPEDVEKAEFAGLSTVNTPTSPNSNVVTTPSGDPNNITNLSFQYQARIPVWTPVLSQAQPSISLGQDITIGTTTWKAGITVVYAALGAAQYTVTIVKGGIVDDRGSYELAGILLGIFPIG